MVKSIRIRLVLHLAVTRSWPIKQLDVNNAFLQGTLSDEVYVTQPPGFVDPDRSHHVCRLRKALYGLKQAPRAWYQELKTFLCQMRCTNSTADTSVFIYKTESTSSTFLSTSMILSSLVVVPSLSLLAYMFCPSDFP